MQVGAGCRVQSADLSHPLPALFAAVLNGKGRTLLEVLVVAAPGPGAFLVDVYAACGDALLAHLTRFKLRSRVQITRSGDLRVGVVLPEEEVGDDGGCPHQPTVSCTPTPHPP